MVSSHHFHLQDLLTMVLSDLTASIQEVVSNQILVFKFQVFHNLGVLATVVERVVSGCYDSLHQGVRSCLDVTALSQQQSFSGKGK